MALPDSSSSSDIPGSHIIVIIETSMFELDLPVLAVSISIPGNE